MNCLNNKNLFLQTLLVILLVVLMQSFSDLNKKNQLPKHSTLMSDYAKVVVTWNPPNQPPNWSAGPRETPTSSTSSPTNAGDNVTFYATGTDPEGDNYYFIVCTSSAVTAHNNAAPTCNGGTWCVSGSVASGSGASCATTTVEAWDHDNNWWGYLCDYNAVSACTTSNQGTGEPGSPFAVNHHPGTPVYGGCGPSTGDPGTTVGTCAQINPPGDPDGDSPLAMYICKTNATSSGGCASGQEWCNSPDAGAIGYCDLTAPLPGEGDYTLYTFTKDPYGLFSTSSYQMTLTVNNVTPTTSNVVLNGGANMDISIGGEGPNGSTTIIATTDVTDNNGCADVSAVEGYSYPLASSSACTSQNNNFCYYNISCATSSACNSGITQQYSCSFNFKYHADPTDVDTIRINDKWIAAANAVDEGGYGNTATSSGVEMLSFVALDATPAINYATLQIGEIANAATLPTTTVVTSTGNTGIDVQLSGIAMSGTGTSSIAVGQQKYATSGVAYSAATALSGTPTSLLLGVKKTTTTASCANKTMYWGLQVPSGTGAGTYTGSNTFTAVKSATSTW